MGRCRLRLPFRRPSPAPPAGVAPPFASPPQLPFRRCPRNAPAILPLSTRLWKRRWRSQRAPRKVPRAAMGCRCRRMRHHSPFRRLLMPLCLQSLPASVIDPSRCCCACVGPFLALRMRQPIARVAQADPPCECRRRCRCPRWRHWRRRRIRLRAHLGLRSAPATSTAGRPHCFHLH